MKTLRNALAFPFYLLAVSFHLLCAGSTWVAEKIADDRDPDAISSFKLRGVEILLGVVFTAALLGISTVPLLIRHPAETDSARLEVSRPMKDSEFTKADFTPSRLEAAIPAIRLAACLFAEKAVRHHVSPTPIGFSPCESPAINVAISDNLIDITVSGIASVYKVEKPFTVTLQHNPPSVTEDGLIVTGIKIDTNGLAARE